MLGDASFCSSLDAKNAEKDGNNGVFRLKATDHLVKVCSYKPHLEGVVQSNPLALGTRTQVPVITNSTMTS